MLVVTREGDRRCNLRLSQRAMVALLYLREHTILAGEAMALVALADVLQGRGKPEAVTTALVRAAHLFHDLGD